jgi:hypothetical protein
MKPNWLDDFLIAVDKNPVEFGLLLALFVCAIVLMVTL